MRAKFISLCVCVFGMLLVLFKISNKSSLLIVVNFLFLSERMVGCCLLLVLAKHISSYFLPKKLYAIVISVLFAGCRIQC